MERLKFFLFCWLYFVSLSIAVFYRFPDKGNEHQYITQADKFVNDTTYPHTTTNYTQYEQCIGECNSLRKICKTISIKVLDKGYQCTFYSNDDPKVVESTEASKYILVTKKKAKQCSTICKELEYMKLCGECHCRDLCVGKGEVPRFECDCRDAVPVKRDCDEIFQSGNKASGRYYIDPSNNGNKFEVYCEMYLKNVVVEQTDPSCTDNFLISNSQIYYNKGYINRHDCFRICESENAKAINRIISDNGCYCIFDEPATWRLAHHHDLETCTFYTQRFTRPQTAQQRAAILLMGRWQGKKQIWHQSFEAYKKGFNDSDNHWMGLANLHTYLNYYNADLRFQGIDTAGKTYVSFYRNVQVAHENQKYKIAYSEYARMGSGESNRIPSHAEHFFEFCEGVYWWIPHQQCPYVPTADYGDAYVHYGDMRYKNFAIYIVNSKLKIQQP